MTARSPRADFPALARAPTVHYLDSACMTLVPRTVLRAMREYYERYPGCAGRSLHRWSEQVGTRYERARAEVARWFGVREPAAVAFQRNTTEAINVVAHGLPLRRGDRIVLTDQEHSSNLVVWLRRAKELGARLVFLRLRDDGRFDPDAFQALWHQPVRLVSVFHTSNLDGRSLPIRELVEIAHDHHTPVLVDGSQAASHHRVEVDRWSIDYYAASGHKMLGPTGTGLLTGSPTALEALRPLTLGGETVEWASETGFALRKIPYRLEAGLQNYAGVLGLAEAIAYLRRVGVEEIVDRQRTVNRLVTEELMDERRVHVLGPSDPDERPSIYAFTIDGVDPHDAALFLDEAQRVLVRSGRHCVQSWYHRRGLVGNVRASFHLYNDRSDARALVRGVRELVERLARPGGPGPRPPTTTARRYRRAPS